MAEERIFTIPLRDAFSVPRTKRTKKAISVVRAYLKRHMKAEKVSVGKSINEKLWKRGIQKPPRKVKVHAMLEDKTVYAELVGVDIKVPGAEEKKKKEEKKKEKKEKIKKERKERRKQTIQEELEEGASQKKGPQEVVEEEKAAKTEEKVVKPKKETEEARAERQKTSKG